MSILETKEGHAALMDGVYRRQRYIYDFTRKYYLFGRDRLIRELRLRDGERLVEVGCGTARNLIHIARRYPMARLYGLDISAEMLRSARTSIRKAEIEGRVALAQGMAEALTAQMFGETTPFDRVVFSYSLSMIPDWRQALAAAARSCGPKGSVHIVDFGDLTGLSRMGEKVLRFWLSLFHVSPRTELIEAFESGLSDEVDLCILPGRYAFLAQGKGEQIANAAKGMLQLSHMAAGIPETPA